MPALLAGLGNHPVQGGHPLPPGDTMTILTPSMTQAQLIEFLDHYRTDAKDIPATLEAICDHIHFCIPMHHDTVTFNDEFATQIGATANAEHNAWNTYQDAAWALINFHFKNTHDLDLTDPAINWAFDT